MFCAVWLIWASKTLLLNVLPALDNISAPNHKFGNCSIIVVGYRIGLLVLSEHLVRQGKLFFKLKFDLNIVLHLKKIRDKTG